MTTREICIIEDTLTFMQQDIELLNKKIEEEKSLPIGQYNSKRHTALVDEYCKIITQQSTIIDLLLKLDYYTYTDTNGTTIQKVINLL